MEEELLWVLASNSPRRKELLSQILDFAVICAEIDETVKEDLPPEKIVQELALRKARFTFEHLIKMKEILKNEKNLDDEMLMEAKIVSDNHTFGVIGADTVVVLDGKIYGKPKDKDDAFRILKELSGKTHSVLTGVAVVKLTGTKVFYSETKVTFDKLPDDEIWEYIENGEPMDKAGAYGIQGFGGTFVTGIEGDYTNVVGFPMGEFCHLIRIGEIEL